MSTRSAAVGDASYKSSSLREPRFTFWRWEGKAGIHEWEEGLRKGEKKEAKYSMPPPPSVAAAAGAPSEGIQEGPFTLAFHYSTCCYWAIVFHTPSQSHEGLDL